MAKKETLPLCEEFLIYAVRFLRPKRNEIHGVRLARLYNAARDHYSEKMIRAMLNEAIKRQKLLIVARERKNYESGIYHWRHRDRSLDFLPDSYRLDLDGWRLNANRESVRELSDTATFVDRVLVYVVEDGIPDTAFHALTVNSNFDVPKKPKLKLGARILKEMREVKARK